MGGYASWALEGAKMIAGQQQNDQADKAQAEQIAAQNAYLAQQQQIETKQRRDLLERQLASARARLAAGGIGMGAGSGQALMAGMVRDNESQLADSTALFLTKQAGSTSSTGSSSSGALLQGLEALQQGMSWMRGFSGTQN